MNKTELVKALARETGSTIAHTDHMLDTLFDVIAERLQAGESVTITGVGTFVVRTRNARPGVNPRTKEPLTIAAHSVVGFSVSKPFTKRVTAAE